MEMKDYRNELLNILYTKSFRFDPEKGFTLASGQKSDVYIDVKKTVLRAEGMRLTGYAFYQALKDEELDGIGGLTLGADPIAYAAALTSTLNGKPLNAFIVRKEPKKHGTQQWIESTLEKGAKVAIVDDVVTTGGSTIKAIERALLAGFDVRRVITLVDREEGGRENIEKIIKCRFDSIFKKKDLVDLYMKEKGR